MILKNILRTIHKKIGWNTHLVVIWFTIFWFQEMESITDSLSSCLVQPLINPLPLLDSRPDYWTGRVKVSAGRKRVGS